MSDFAKVFGIQLKARFSLSGSKKGMLKSIGLGILVVISVISLIGAWAGLLYLFFSGLEMINMLDLGLLLPFLAGMVVVLIFGVPGVLGILFQSKDISFLASLPVRQGTVFASKFFLVYLYELSISLVFLLPAIIVYGIIAGVSAVFYLKGVLAVLLLPMLPLVLSSLISLVLMRFSGLTKRRELFMVIGGFILTIGYVVGQNMLMSRISQMSQEAILAYLEQANGIVRLIGSAFPPALWAVNAVTMTGADSLINWALYLLSTIGAFAVAYYVGSKLYMSGALAQLETAKRGKKARLDTRKLQSGSPLRAMAVRELKLIIRSPIYALNCLIGVFMFPALLFIMPSMTGTDLDVQAFADFVSSVPKSTIFIVGLGAGYLFCMTNMAAATVLSREGGYFWLSKVIPVPYRTQVFGKLIFSWSVDAATILFGAIAALFMFPEFSLYILLAAICSLVGAVSLTAVSMMIDISRPKLKWSSETEAVKQNINGVLGMLATIVLGAGFVFLSLLFSLFASPVVNFFLTLIAASAAAVGSVILLGILADSRYRRLEP